MLSCGDSRNRVSHQSSTAGFSLITSIKMIVQRACRSYLFCIRGIRKDLPQQTRPNRPPLSMKVVKVRIDAATDKFQLSHLRSSLAIGIGITQLANGDKPANMARTALAIGPRRDRAPIHARPRRSDWLSDKKVPVRSPAPHLSRERSLK